jgi:D-alanine-D-alanine ligase-like ATP-grasp enzyme
MKHCKDCEPAQEIHAIAYLSVILGWIDQPFFSFMEMIFKNTADSIADKFTLPFFNLMVYLHLGYFTNEPDEKDTWRTKCFWQEATRRGIKMKEFHLGPIRDGFVAEFRGKTIIFNGLPRPGLKESPSLYWMDNKGTMKEKFMKEGLPVADGGVAWSKNGALKIFNRIKKPVITKPNLGSRSRHTTIHINTREELIAGFKKARKLSPLIVIEEELKGHLFRGTLVGGKLVGTVKRDPPEVTGDGVSALRALWEKENERPERAGPIFHKIILEGDAEAELSRQEMSMDSIPRKGQTVTFSQKTSRGCGGTTTEVSGTEHPENIKMLEHVASFLNDPLIGVDFIMQDITKSWREQEHCGIIECNSLPFIDLHHYPLYGAPNNIAGALWDLVMPASTRESTLAGRSRRHDNKLFS